MATILLSTVAGSVASNIGLGAFGTAVLQGALGTVGKFVDSSLMGGSRHSEGPRLADLAVQTSTYGRMIPVVYGTVRIAGNIIWARPIKEEATTTTSSAGGGKGVGGGKASQSSTSYSYYATLAIAICEGRIDEILRVWADSKQLDISLGTYRLYKGGEGQLADPLIESFEGVGHTPAYRGMAYVVLEDFPLADFGNRIPNFTFEVKKKLLTPDVAGDSVENLIESVIMIPGSGEFVYDTVIQKKIGGEEVAGEWAQQGEQSRINMHNTKGKANALLSLDQLQETCPNVEWVGVVATWFGSSLDAGACTIKPGVEYKTGATTAPEIWTVAGFNRASAIQITLIDDSPRYGGTPDDQSLLRYLDALQARGLKVMFYPMFFMDVDGKPWRGHVTDVSSRSMGSNCVYVQLTNGTTVTASHQTAAGIVTVGYAVVEFASGVTQSVQEQKIIIPANTLSTTATISSVNMSSCLLLYGGWGMHTPTTTIPDRFPIAYLSNATTIAVERAATSNTQPAIVVTAVEFDPSYVASKQAGQTVITSATSANATISSVNTAKSLLTMLHHKFPASSTDMGDCYATGEITASTTVTFVRGSSIATALTTSWEVMEFV